MTSSALFSLCNSLAMFSWIALVVLPRQIWTRRVVQSVVIVLFAIIYTVIVTRTLKPGDLSSFGSLEGVMSLFTQPEAVLVGWVHYLAFDLMVGLYILNSGQKHNIPHLILVPCLFLTFMLGPIGLLVYTIIRTARTKKYWVEYL